MLLEVGHVVRAHGLRGEVVVHLSTNVEHRLRAGAVLHAEGGRTLEVLRSSPHGTRWIVAFAGVGDRTAAERLRGTVLLAEPMEGDPDGGDGGGDGREDGGILWVHRLIGATVVDPAGEALGTVTAVEANPASDLLVLDGGALVPLRFVVSTEPGRIVVDPPPGLLEL